MAVEDKINSNESEGAFNEFIEDQLEDIVEDIINSGNLDDFGIDGSDIIVEMDDITPPTFSYGGPQEGGGRGAGGPGNESDSIRFTVPYDRFMELVKDKLRLPDLKKEGRGKIKEVSYTFRTFGPTGIILDKKRTFKRALKSSVALGTYNPKEDKYEVQFRKKDRRYKLPQRVEKPKFKAVVFYMGDISYSTYGERLNLEKRIVNFIHQWLNFNYGAQNVEHRFFVHDADAHEVRPEDFYSVSNAGGTRASIVFDLVGQVAFNEYDLFSTNFYGFYFGDGEIFEDDAKEIITHLKETILPNFNRVGIVEVIPSSMSHLKKALDKTFTNDPKLRTGIIKEKSQTIELIKTLFGERINA